MRLADVEVGQRVAINGARDLMVLHPDKLHIGEVGVVMKITKAGRVLVRTPVGECTFNAVNLDPVGG
jgi:hypothetical protein